MNSATTIVPQGTPPRRRSPVLPVIAGVTGATLVLGVTGYLAATRLMAAPGGPEDVIPGNAFASLRLDMDPSLSQKASFVKLRDRLPGLDEQDGEAKDLVCDAVLPLLDCDILKPSLGDRFAVAAWPGETPGKPSYAAFVQVNDAEAAEEAVAQAYPTAIVHEGYLIVDGDADTPSAAEVPTDLGAHGALADNDRYEGDLDKLNMDGVAHVWVNLARLRDDLNASGLMAPSVTSGLGIDGLDTQLNELQGSLVGALALQDDGLRLRILGLDLGDLSEHPAAKPLQQLGDLPAGTWAAAGVSGFAESFARAMDTAPAGQWDTVEDALGISLPQDLPSLLGNELVAGVAGASEAELSVQARLLGADPEVVQRAVDSVAAEESVPTVTVAQSDASVLLGFGPQRSGRLGTDPRFARALPGLADAQSAFFVDFDAMATMTQDQDLDGLGFMGVTSAVDHDEARLQLAADWILP